MNLRKRPRSGATVKTFPIGRLLHRISLLAIATVAALSLPPREARADGAQIARGRYLVQIAGCNDCHTPGYFRGMPDTSRYLSGSDVGFTLPDGGVVIGSNLTPDKETGLGGWTVEQIARAIQTGVRPDGRVLAPIMPYTAFAHLTSSDATAIAVFLKTLAPIKRQIPGPFTAKQKANVFRLQVLPPETPAAAGH